MIKDLVEGKLYDAKRARYDAWETLQRCQKRYDEAQKAFEYWSEKQKQLEESGIE